MLSPFSLSVASLLLLCWWEGQCFQLLLHNSHPSILHTPTISRSHHNRCPVTHFPILGILFRTDALMALYLLYGLVLHALGWRHICQQHFLKVFQNIFSDVWWVLDDMLDVRSNCHGDLFHLSLSLISSENVMSWSQLLPMDNPQHLRILHLDTD